MPQFFHDIESGEAVTLATLRKEYDRMKAEQPDEYGYTFPEYVSNCMTWNNGTLQPYPNTEKED